MPDFESKYIEARQVIQEWVDKQGHDRCWYYPELFRRLLDIYDIRPSKDPHLPKIEEFRAGCERYQREQYNIGEDI